MPRFDREAQPAEFGRVLAFSDGVFTVALTLLGLDLALSEAAARQELSQELLDRQSHFLAFGISLWVVGSAWWSHYRLFFLLQGVNGPLLALNIIYVGLVVLIPFAQSVLSGYPFEPLAYVIFGGVLAAIGTVDTGMLAYARRCGLLRGHVTPDDERVELLTGVAYVLTFVASLPLAYLLGPLTIVIWLLFLPVSRLLLKFQARDNRPGVRG